MAASFSTGERSLRRFFRLLNGLMLLFWRPGQGRLLNAWPQVGGRIMVIGHTGRRTGRLHRNPVNYALFEGAVYCTAGFGSRCDWYRNLRKDPHVEVWLPGERWIGLAEDASDAPDAVSRLRQVLIASGFAAYLAGLNPIRMQDDEVEALIDSYRLVRISRRDGGEVAA